MDLRKQLLECIEENGIVVLEDGSLQMDSLNFIGMIVSIETTFSIEIPDDLLVADTLSSFDGIYHVLEKLLMND